MALSEEIKQIQKQFEDVIHFSQAIPALKDERTVNTDKLFEQWLEAKRDFIEAFGGKLIIELGEKVTFELSPEEKIDRVKDFLTMVDYKYENSELAAFIDIQKDGFYDNTVIRDYEYYDVKIPKGMKMIKAFKYFEDDPKLLEEMQNAASMLIQEDKISGYLCLSAHPLDYISASENCHKWHSCHALDGDYRAGNLSYMVDKNTIICYLRAEKTDYILPDFPESVPWNSKKWRVWIHLSDDWEIMFAGRQYPFTANAGLNKAKLELIEPALKTHYTNFTNQYISGRLKLSVPEGEFIPSSSETLDNERYMIIDGVPAALSQIVKDHKNNLAFNDLLRSSFYVPQYAYKIKPVRYWFDDEETLNHFVTQVHHRADEYGRVLPRFTIGGPVRCVVCGENILNFSSSFVCSDCQNERLPYIRRKYDKLIGLKKYLMGEEEII